MTKHLWEATHPYHCAEGNYNYVPNADLHRQYDSITGFLGDWADGEDDDYNLLFRWDWIKEEQPRPEDQYFTHGPAAGSDRLMLFYVQQRRGNLFSVAVAVKDEDEAAVRSYLEGKAQHIRTLWEPLLDLTIDEAMEQLI